MQTDSADKVTYVPEMSRALRVARLFGPLKQRTR